MPAAGAPLAMPWSVPSSVHGTPVGVALIRGPMFTAGGIAPAATAAATAAFVRRVVACRALPVATFALERRLRRRARRQWPGATLPAKRPRAGLSPPAVTARASIAGAPMLVAAVRVEESAFLPPASPAAWTAIARPGVPGTPGAFVWYNEAVCRPGAARAAASVNLVPAAAVAQAWPKRGERLDASMLAGGALLPDGVHLPKASRKA